MPCGRWVSDKSERCQALGVLQVELSEPGSDRPITVRFHFGHTELKVTAFDQRRGDKVDAKLVFAHEQEA